jgi:hypothetical protein
MHRVRKRKEEEGRRGKKRVGMSGRKVRLRVLNDHKLERSSRSSHARSLRDSMGVLNPGTAMAATISFWLGVGTSSIEFDCIEMVLQDAWYHIVEVTSHGPSSQLPWRRR